MSKLFLCCSFVLKHKTGVGAYVLTLIKALSKLNKKYELQELNLPNNVKYKIFWEAIWYNTVLFIKTLFKKPVMAIFPALTMPKILRKKTKYITVIHDLCVYRECEVNNVIKWAKFMQKEIANTINKADIIVTVSEQIKKELIEKFKVNPERVKVVYNSIGEHFINAQFNDDIIKKYNLESKKYILSVATLNKRKNIPTLIKAFEQISEKYPDLKLVLVGGMGNEDRKILTNHPNIVFTGYIKDEELPTLYKNALLYMYPSLYEGFGIPLIEAQYCGCPVLCSDIPVFREIGANSVEYCEPTTVGIANGLEYLINNSQRLQELSVFGKENVKRFSIEKIAEQVNEVIDDKN